MAKKFSRIALAQEIVKRLDSGDDISKISKGVAAFLIENNKTHEVNSLLRDCMELRAKKSGTVELTAASSHKLTGDQKKDITDKVRNIYPTSKKVIIHEELDENVIGGLKLTFANANLDLTIRGKLNQLRALVS